MCGRFALIAPGEAVAEAFALDEAPAPLPPRYNIAPTQPVLGVRLAADGRREAALFRWGLIPSWAKDISIGSRMINARSETTADKPSFRAAFKRRRCLIPASGFYEWEPYAGAKRPVVFAPPADQALALAGLWERWRDPGGEIQYSSLNM